MKKKTKKRRLPTCQYCGSTAVLRPASDIYADGDPNRHLCVCSRYPECDAYVSVDERTLEPLGTLANGDLRHKRIEAHRLFDEIWRRRIMTWANAYR